MYCRCEPVIHSRTARFKDPWAGRDLRAIPLRCKTKKFAEPLGNRERLLTGKELCFWDYQLDIFVFCGTRSLFSDWIEWRCMWACCRQCHHVYQCKIVEADLSLSTLISQLESGARHLVDLLITCVSHLIYFSFHSTGIVTSVILWPDCKFWRGSPSGEFHAFLWVMECAHIQPRKVYLADRSWNNPWRRRVIWKWDRKWTVI